MKKRILEVILKGLAFVFIPYFIGSPVNYYTGNDIYEAQGNLLIWVVGWLVIAICAALYLGTTELYQYITTGQVSK